MATKVAQVQFTVPGSGTPDHIDLLCKLVESVPAGGEILGCNSNADRGTPLLEALRRACDRGVTVRMLLWESTNKKNPNKGANAALRWLRKTGITECLSTRKGVFSGRRKLHTKLLLLSEATVDGSRRRCVSVIGSATWTTESLSKHQDVVVLEDAAVYAGLKHYWESMASLVRTPTRRRVAPDRGPQFFTSADGRIRIDTGPWLAQDRIHEELTALETRRGPHGERPHLRIAIAQCVFEGPVGSEKVSRAERLLRNVERLLATGCLVSIASRWIKTVTINPKTKKERIKYTVNPSAENRLKELLRAYPCGKRLGERGALRVFKGAKEGPLNIHNKYFLFHGARADAGWGHTVWTGSTNWTNDGLHYNDELLARISSKNTYMKYKDHFKKLTEFLPALDPK